VNFFVNLVIFAEKPVAALQATGAGCHDNITSHLSDSVAHNTFGQTRICILLDNQRGMILGFELQL